MKILSRLARNSDKHDAGYYLLSNEEEIRYLLEQTCRERQTKNVGTVT